MSYEQQLEEKLLRLPQQLDHDCNELLRAAPLGSEIEKEIRHRVDSIKRIVERAANDVRRTREAVQANRF